MKKRTMRTSILGRTVNWNVLGIVCCVIFSHAQLFAYTKIYQPRYLARLGGKGPCLASLIGPPSTKEQCIAWQNNIRAIPTFDSARRYIFAGGALDGLYVVDADTGMTQGILPLKGRAVTKVLFSSDGERIFVGTDKGVVSSFDAFDFKHKFDFVADGKINDDLILRDGRLYFTSFLSTVYAVDALTGKLEWQSERPMLRSRVKIEPMSDMLFVEQGLGDKKSISLMVPHPDGYLSIFSAHDGKFLRKIQVAQRQTAFPDIVAPMVELAGMVWVASDDAGLYSIDLLTGQIKQRLEIQGIVQLIAAGNVLVIATTDALLAIEPNGKKLWKNEYSQVKSKKVRYPFPFNALSADGKRILQGTPSKMLIQNHKIAMATSEGAIGFFDVASGQLLGVAGIDLGFGPALLSIEGQIAAITQSGSLVVFAGL